MPLCRELLQCTVCINLNRTREICNLTVFGYIPLSTDLAGEGLLVGMRHHVSPQILLVLGGKAAAGTLVRSQVGMHDHVGLGKGMGQPCVEMLWK